MKYNSYRLTKNENTVDLVYVYEDLQESETKQTLNKITLALT